MVLFNDILPDRTQVVWMTTPPISADIRSGIMIQQLEFQQKSMRFNIMEGNQYAATVTAAYGYDVLGEYTALNPRIFIYFSNCVP